MGLTCWAIFAEGSKHCALEAKMPDEEVMFHSLRRSGRFEDARSRLRPSTPYLRVSVSVEPENVLVQND